MESSVFYPLSVFLHVLQVYSSLALNILRLSVLKEWQAMWAANYLFIYIHRASVQPVMNTN
jgi:hypothetical protein